MGEREKDGRGEKDLRYFCFSLKPVILARERISREPVKIFHLLSLFSSFLIEKSALKIGAPRGFLPVSFNFLVLFIFDQSDRVRVSGENSTPRAFVEVDENP